MDEIAVVSELRLLRDENADLRERVAYLESGFRADDLSLPNEWRLSPSERRIFGRILQTPLATKDAIMAAIYYDRPNDEPDWPILNVLVFRMRRKLAPFGIDIKNYFGRGYALSPNVRARFKRKKAMS